MNQIDRHEAHFNTNLVLIDRNSAIIESVQRTSDTRQLLIDANWLSIEAHQYYVAARENFQLMQYLDDDDPAEYHDKQVLMEQRETYLCMARELDFQAQLLRIKALENAKG